MARAFAAGTDRIAHTLYPAIQGLDAFTVAAWTRITGNGGNNLGRIAILGNNGGPADWDLFNGVLSAQTRLRFIANRWGTTAGEWRWGSTWTGNSTFHVAVTYDYGSTANDPIFYKEGVAETTTEVTAPVGTLQASAAAGSLYIGNTSASNRGWSGQLWDVAIWNRVLTASEIRSVYHFGPPRLLGGLVFYAPMRGDSPEGNYVVGGTSGTVVGATVADEFHRGWSPWGLETGHAVGGQTAAPAAGRSFVAGMIG